MWPSQLGIGIPHMSKNVQNHEGPIPCSLLVQVLRIHCSCSSECMGWDSASISETRVWVSSAVQAGAFHGRSGCAWLTSCFGACFESDDSGAYVEDRTALLSLLETELWPLLGISPQVGAGHLILSFIFGSLGRHEGEGGLAHMPGMSKSTYLGDAVYCMRPANRSSGTRGQEQCASSSEIMTTVFGTQSQNSLSGLRCLSLRHAISPLTFIWHASGA